MESPSVIDTDLLCGRCGYNLRTLKMDGKCPECGVSVGRTFRGDAWGEADARWRADIVIGLAALTLAVLLWVGQQVLQGQGFKIENFSGTIVNIFAVLVLLGVIFMTRAEPEPLKMERPWSRRRLLRWGTINLIALFAASRWLNVGNAMSAPGSLPIRLLVLFMMAGTFPLIVIFALTVADFVKRTGRKPLARLWRITAWAGVASGLLCVGPTAYWFFLRRSGSSDEMANLAIVLPTVAVMVFLAGLLARTTLVLWRNK